MVLALIELVGGLLLLGWSADRFVLGSASTARHLGLPALLIGMVIIGFGTSAPELVVSAFASSEGHPEIALGNAYGSNIANIGLVLGIAALVSPIFVHRGAVKVEIPMLFGVLALAAWQYRDHELSRPEAAILLVAFAAFIGWSFWHSTRTKGEHLAIDAEQELAEAGLSRSASVIWMLVGLVLLVASSYYLVEGAKEVAHRLGLSDLVIGLTVIAIGTSLPELASAVAAARRSEHDLIIGNIVGSCLFNALGVVGLAGVIHPVRVDPEILTRDLPALGILTIALALIAYRFRRDRHINRFQGLLLLVGFVTYTVWVLVSSL
jgi:cation:H+ antiporter